MGNIVGEDHLQYVKTQIKDRQQILGKNIKSNEDVVWANNKGGWCRLMSSINIADQDVIRFDKDTNTTTTGSDNGSEFRNQYLDLQDYGGPMLAQELILQGGILNYDTPKFGISDSTSNLPGENSNYGYGGTEFGLNAMPGLLGFTSKTYDNGSLRKAIIKIKANNKKQFEYLESTYIRLGYTMLLEWGNTTFPLQETNDEGTSFTRYATTGDNAALSLKDEFLYSYNKGQDYFYTRIEELRKESQGNYDGFLGMVDNFDWEFQKDGSYLITLNLITVGSVIQSLKGNISLPTVTYPSPDSDESNESSPEEDRPTALEVAIDILSECKIEKETTKVKNTIGSLLTSVAPLAIAPSYLVKSTLVTKPTKSFLSEEESKSLGLNIDDLSNGGGVIACTAALGDSAFNVQRYLRLGTLLEFINKKLLLYDEDLNPTHITIDTSIDTYCYSNGWSFPADLEKMIISYDKKIGDEEFKIFSEPETKIDQFHSKKSFSSSREINVGRVMNLYFNRSYLKILIRQYTDDKKGLSIYKFIEELLNTANSQLGNVNKLKLRVTNKKSSETVFSVEGEAVYRGFDGTGEGDVAGTDQIAVSNSQFQEPTFTTKTVVKQVLEIYDEVAFTETPADPSFIVYGFNDKNIEPSNPLAQQEGSFVTDLSLKTNIDKNLTTQIAIGAQAGGRAVGYDSMIFSKWNVGLIDRVIPSKLDIEKAKRGNVEERTDWKKLRETYRKYLSKLTETRIGELTSNTEESSFLRQFVFSIQATYKGYIIPKIYLSGNKNEEPSFSRFQTVQANFFNKVLAWDAERKNTITPFVGFLPINLSLTIDGLSGIKIFDKLTIDSRFLPKNYTNTLNFIITELDHNFENNKWVTKLGTLSIPKLFPDNLVTGPTNSPLPSPNDIAEVIIGQAVETPQDKEKGRQGKGSDFIPSYFSIRNNVYRGLRQRGQVGQNNPLFETTRGGKEIIPEILGLLNQSPVVQNRFRNFLNEIIDKYPQGYAFTINSATRSLVNPSGVGLGSAHTYGLAIDFSVREAKPEGQEDLYSQGPNILYGYGGNKTEFKRWMELGIPEIADLNNITWGGNFRGETYKYDCVHFAVQPIPWPKASLAIQTSLKLTLPILQSKINQAKKNLQSKAGILVNNVNVQNFVLLKQDPNNPKNVLYATKPDKIEFGTRVINAKSALGFNSNSNINFPDPNLPTPDITSI